MSEPVRVFDATGRPIAVGSIEQIGERVIVAKLNDGLPNGTYAVAWRFVSADSHPLRGAFVFPLESGLLTGKYRRGEPGPDGARLTGRLDRLTDELLERVETLEAVAQRQGRSLLELAIGGLASIPGIASVIAGATRPEQARANAEAGSWHATGDELDAITPAVG